jgi:hypothetical protein
MTIAAGSTATLTNAATINILGPPIQGTNETITNLYSVWNQAGEIRNDGLDGCLHGSNKYCGVATLASGTVTVSTTAIAALAASGAAGDAVELVLQNCSTCGTLSVGTVTAGTSFVINSTNVLDASLVFWRIKHIN